MFAPLGNFIDSKSGDSKIIKGKQSASPRQGLVPAYSASGQDIWVGGGGRHVGDGIVISAVGARCGKTFLASGEWTAIANTHVLRIKDGAPIDIRWLWYLTNNESFWIKSGTAQPFVKVKATLEREQWIPSIEQQREIVERIESALKKIGLTADALARSEATLVNLRRSALAESFAASNSTQPLGEVVKVLDNLRVPVSAKVRQTRLGNIPYYGASGQVGTIDLALFDEELLLLGEDGVQFFDPTKPKAFRISGPSWVNNHAHVLRPDSSKVLLGYLLHYLNDFDYRGYANGTTRLKLTKSAMWSIPVPVVSLEQQRETVERIESLLMAADRLSQAVESSKSTLKDLRRAYLRDEFGGNQQ